MDESAIAAPDLELPDENGNLVRLSAYRERRKLVVFFVRSFL